jgi:hypothetical protein
MRSGLDDDDEDPSTPGNEDNLDKLSDWIRTIYGVPMKGFPDRNITIARSMLF